MYRRVFISVFLALVYLGVTADPLLAKPVQSGAMDICKLIDEGVVRIVTENGAEICCAHETTTNEGHDGPLYCVVCRPAGSNNCELEYVRVQGVAILGDAILAQQQGIVIDVADHDRIIGQLVTGLNNLQKRVDDLQAACTVVK